MQELPSYYIKTLYLSDTQRRYCYPQKCLPVLKTRYEVTYLDLNNLHYADITFSLADGCVSCTGGSFDPFSCKFEDLVLDGLVYDIKLPYRLNLRGGTGCTSTPDIILALGRVIDGWDIAYKICAIDSIILHDYYNYWVHKIIYIDSKGLPTTKENWFDELAMIKYDIAHDIKRISRLW